MTCIMDMRGDLKGHGHQAALGGCSSHHLQGWRYNLVAQAPLQATQLVYMVCGK